MGELEGVLDLAGGFHHIVERDLHTVHLQGGESHLRPLADVLRQILQLQLIPTIPVFRDFV